MTTSSYKASSKVIRCLLAVAFLAKACDGFWLFSAQPEGKTDSFQGSASATKNVVRDQSL
jgi:hypothetical protein